MRPVQRAELGGGQLSEWLNGCEWVKKTPQSDDWAMRNMDSVRSKYQTYHAKWMGKPAASRPRLLKQDGS